MSLKLAFFWLDGSHKEKLLTVSGWGLYLLSHISANRLKLSLTEHSEQSEVWAYGFDDNSLKVKLCSFSVF